MDTMLSGLVAILDDHGTLLETRDLGPEPVEVKPGHVLSIEDVRPALDPLTEAYGEPKIEVTPERVVRTYPVLPIVVEPSEVKAEAARRIEVILPDYKQRNALAFGLEAVMAYGPDPAVWPKELQAMNAALQAKWAAIKAIRARSDEIEAMQPVPADFRDDSRWP